MSPRGPPAATAEASSDAAADAEANGDAEANAKNGSLSQQLTPNSLLFDRSRSQSFDEKSL